MPQSDIPDMWHKQFTFDDMAIGLPNGDSLGLILIARPPGLSNNEWYKHAAVVCQQLARVSNVQPNDRANA